MKKLLFTRLIVLLLCGASGASFAAEQPEAGRADKLKAGYLVNFAKFVEWPASEPPDVLTICFLGGSGVRVALTTDLARKRVGNRRLALRALAPGDRPDGCEVLYMESPDFAVVRRLMRLAPSAVLTVSDSADFAHRGGMIELFTAANRLHFDINVASARRAGLRVSSTLLQLATTVVQEDAQ